MTACLSSIDKRSSKIPPATAGGTDRYCSKGGVDERGAEGRLEAGGGGGGRVPRGARRLPEVQRVRLRRQDRARDGRVARPGARARARVRGRGGERRRLRARPQG